METPGWSPQTSRRAPLGFPVLSPAVPCSVISSCGFWKPLVRLPLLALAAQKLLLAGLLLLHFSGKTLKMLQSVRRMAS